MQAGDGAGAYRNAADGVAGGRLAPQIVDTPAQLPVAR